MHEKGVKRLALHVIRDAIAKNDEAFFMESNEMLHLFCGLAGIEVEVILERYNNMREEK